MNVTIVILKIILLLSITLLTYEIMKYTNDKKLIGNAAIKIFNISEESYTKRKNKREQLQLEEGNTKDNSIIHSIDLLIERSHIKEKIPIINTELYIATNIILSVSAFIIGDMIFKNIILALISGMITLLTIYSIFYIMSGINYNKIDSDVLTFINIMENYSGSNDDIETIIEKTYPYLNYPLKQYLEEFCNEVKRTGDLTVSFRNLEYKIENKKVRDIISNIEICSRHEANYQEIIRDSRENIVDYLKSKQQRKALINNGRMEILISLGMCIVMVVSFNSIVPHLLQTLQTSFIGNLILIYSVIIIGICLWQMISFDKEG